ncbi:GH25 family lysozyme [Sphingomonas baiyangensis]|nr:GH25 family lysozyme [Sphingomonas baiyangensis]
MLRVLAGAGLAAAVAGGGWWYAGEWRPAIEAYPVQGVDVDAQSGPVDWGTAKADNIDFVYALATSGEAGRDPAFAAHWQALAQFGIRRGAMHAYSLCAPAIEQADHFNATVPRTLDALPVTITFAFDPACAARPDRTALVEDVSALIERVERHSGKRVLLRIAPAFEEEYRLSEAIDRTVWAERRFFTPGYVARGWRMWQANDMARVDGFDTPVRWSVAAP